MPRSKPERPSSSNPSHGRSGFIRLISGQWKGRKLPVREVEGLRPTTDRVKETLFNWLAADIRGSRCLDLFAGSGSLGFEALSRYASHVMMVEMDKGAAQQLAKNLQTLQSQQARIIQQDALTLLAGPSEPFDIIFLDPPYYRDDRLRGFAAGLVAGVFASGLCAEGCTVVFQHETGLGLPESGPGWALFKAKQYGRTQLSFYRAAPPQ